MDAVADDGTRTKYTPEQLAAAGRAALDMRHAMNNPLAALLAEAQLLALEPLAPEHLEAVNRIVDLCRRAVATVRELDTSTRTAGTA